MPYIPLTEDERREMLAAVGVASMDELWKKAIGPEPEPELKNLPSGASEYEVMRHLSMLASRNASDLVCFLGGGFYDHFIPAAVSEVTGRGEFYTAYTPYQPEASQGTLQAIYEFQSVICRLTGMEVSNASMYDGGTALFEALMMAVRITGRNKVVLCGSISPIYREMVKCYSHNLEIELVFKPDSVVCDGKKLAEALDDKTAAVAVQYPNVFGTVDDWRELTAAAKAKGVVSVCSAYPVALGMITPPGELGFDIVTGEGQSLGIPLSFGGPYLGFMATKRTHMRKMPGRIVGQTADKQGRTGYVLTLQAREQHIRREKAMSNICSNEGLCALRALVYLTCIGKEGLKQVGELCAAKAVFARDQLLAIPGVEGYDQPFFNEFVVKLPCDAGEVVGRMIEKGYAAGFPLGRYFPHRANELLVTVTEKRTREEIRSFAAALEAAIADCRRSA